ncbi:hypothetical protein [Luteolibacter marinus]|uniref:hypothetical protein n=1 Tax=Luteolibacter marinus TaxID=2776705 RepID=UPI00186830CE|nr:hypothetical protein [Luteolibacter marinus]
MFGLRSKRTHRDRQHGLVFQWRLSVGSNLGFLSAIAVVALITAGLAATVRVRVGNVTRQPERRGSLVLLPDGAEWQALEMMAVEAGPLPRRADPATEASVKAIIDLAMADAVPSAYAYQPSLRPVEVEMPAPVASVAVSDSPGMLPALPALRPPSQNPPLPDPSIPLVLAEGEIRALAPAALPPAGLARGNRYLLAYDAAGRVSRVVTLFAANPAEDAGVEAWLRAVKIEKGDPAGGWTAVEISKAS